MPEVNVEKGDRVKSQHLDDIITRGHAPIKGMVSGAATAIPIPAIRSAFTGLAFDSPGLRFAFGLLLWLIYGYNCYNSIRALLDQFNRLPCGAELIGLGFLALVLGGLGVSSPSSTGGVTTVSFIFWTAWRT
jgi:hypothetical protein